MENNTENQEVKTSKELLEALLSSVHPEKDFTDETVFFDQIYDDYEEYAKVLEATAPSGDAAAESPEAQAEAESAEAESAEAESANVPEPTVQQSDGIPLLGGANNSAGLRRHRSIFDIADGAL